MRCGLFKKMSCRYKYALAATILLLLFWVAWLIASNANRRYEALMSDVVFDRLGTPLSIKGNSKGHYVVLTKSLPEEFTNLLIKKEDQFFYYHLGINPVSLLRASYHYLAHGKSGGSSTITQQLAKNLLGTETKRNVLNKLIEAIYATAIEIFNSKEAVLQMYANTVYLGNQVQGFDSASYAYFNKALADTSHSERIALLATLSYPSSRNPWESDNAKWAIDLNERIAPQDIFISPDTTAGYSFQKNSYFELRTAGVKCDHTCTTTIDNDITNSIRAILDRHIELGHTKNIRNGAVVVIDTHTAELLGMVGSRDPNSAVDGGQINMAIQPRPIGSTIKPFLYAKGFEEGLRPYTLVEDREYKYPIATGFPLYPKNYDGQYRGVVTLHEALSNSLNVPSVKVLEYIGLNNFYAFLTDKLKFQPIQELDSYQYGIALGGLEMDLMTLTHYFTIFPRHGSLLPMKILQASDENFDLPPQSNLTEEQMVLSEESIDLVHTIINDRYSGVNQFGLEGSLDLNAVDYGVKTGTSRDFHDSWVVGYTPDFVVGVWLGNSENEALDQISGASGAGAVWHDVMEYLLSTDYNRSSRFISQHLERFPIGNSDEWGLKDDKVEDHRNLLQQDNLILSIHEGDVFELDNNTVIPLKSRRTATWSINGTEYATSDSTTFNPTEVGTYEISAHSPEANKREIINVEVILRE